MATFSKYDASHIFLECIGDDAYGNAHDALEATQVRSEGSIRQRFYGIVEEGVYTFKRYVIRRFSVRFDTRLLPVGANIISAKIEIQLSSKYTTISNTWSIVIQNGQPTYPHYTAVAGDYYHGHYSGNGGSIHCDDLHLGGETNDLVLNTTGIDWINAGGYTKLILRLDHDIDSVDPAPDPPSEGWIDEGVDLQIGSTRLWIVYEAEPVATTQAATGIIYKAAMGNGNITSGTDITERGFEVKVYVNFFGVGPEIFWNLIGFYDEGEIVYHDYGRRTGYLIKRETEIGEFGTGAFAIVLGYPTIFGNPSSIFDDALRECKSYTYRAYATNASGTGYGDWVAFDTPCYPHGHLADDQVPIVPIIPPPPLPDAPIDIFEPPVVPPEPWFPPDIVWPEPPYPDIPPYPSPDWPDPYLDVPYPDINYPDWIYPDFTYPDFTYPDFVYPNVSFPDYVVPDVSLPDFDYSEFEPSLEGSWLKGFYYRKAFRKKGLRDLRRKCRAFQDNMVEYALVLNHNVNVMQQFLNNMTDYTGADEHNTFKRIIPTQHLNALARRPLKLNDFKAIINEFISNCVDNANNVNNNFTLIKNGLEDPQYAEDREFKDIAIRTRLVDEENPDVERLKKVVDALNIETTNNFATINHNLEIVRGILI